MNQNPIQSDFLENFQFNLCDFSLFLSVMKIKRAYECTLSIILDEPDIKLSDVKVEHVILNHSGLRSIRLDAWAQAQDERQFNMEMQNNSKQDDLPKRSRFYQSLIDTPILKAGRKTKYKHLPPTVIIFITQEDIFGKNQAKYTFTEQCEEVSGLKLEDGTTKIFLNMTSKNGSQELVSLLQYMKETRIDNPEILVKDSRILELDEIVTEVKESKEWEAVHMNFMEYCLEEGRRIGQEVGMAEGMAQGMAQGVAQGVAQGESLKLISLTRKKVQKKKTLEEVAEELEESITQIQPIYEMITCYPEKSAKDILEMLDHSN